MAKHRIFFKTSITIDIISINNINFRTISKFAF